MKQQPILDQDIIASVREILTEDYLRESNILNLLPAAVYVCDASGMIRQYNQEAIKLWGRTPRIGDTEERFCGSYKLYYPDGKYMPHHESPMAACLQDGLPKNNLELIIERPDLS